VSHIPGVVNSPSQIAEGWIRQFNAALSSGSRQEFAALFCDDAYWRDLLALTWDLRTFAGRDLIAQTVPMLLEEAGVVSLSPENHDLRFERLPPFSETIGVFLRFDTNQGHCRGYVRLMADRSGGAHKAFTFLSSLQSLHDIHGAVAGPADVDDLDVLIVGAGHAGLALAARLAELGISTVLVERNKKVGDNWRNRYSSLRLHNQLCSCHLPRLPFPADWPMYLPKDMVADFLGTYAEELGLNVRTDTEVTRAEYKNDAWAVELCAGGRMQTLRPRYVVMATGVTGSVPKAPVIEGAASFAGTIMHTRDYLGTERVGGRNAVIIGAATSAHDIAQDLYHRGAASVTIVQRSSIVVVSLKGSQAQYAMYRDAKPGETIEDLDFVASTISYPLAKKIWIPITKRLAAQDKDLIDGLNRAGFRTDLGEDDSGFIIRSLMTYGQYYINVGGSELIIEGKVQVKSGVSLGRVTPNEVILSDGTALTADLLILATGFETIQDDIRRICGSEIAERVGPVWGMSALDGEIRGLWRPTGQPKFFVMGGGLSACRIYSHYLALQIQAGLRGLGPDLAHGAPRRAHHRAEAAKQCPGRDVPADRLEK
jgi:cation diffusion facilitator CzcD-associated flavoprotein CzcO